jgi:deoxyribose-phosphate aldolase
MDPNIEQEARPALETYEDLARLMEHSLTRPDLSEEDVIAGLWLAREYRVAAAVVRPCDVDLAVRTLDGSGVAVASVAGFPHGSSNTATKLYEGRDLLRRGAKEISIVVNVGKMISRQFQHIETEILQMSESCHQEGALCKVIFENGYLADDLKVILCRICKRCEVDFAETSTCFAPTGYTLPDLALMKSILKDRVKMKASGGVRTLERAFEVYNAGCDRFGATATAVILEDWKRILAEREAEKKRAAAQAQAT